MMRATLVADVLLALLLRGHLRTRWRRLVLLAGTVAIGLFGFFLVLMVAGGARDAIVAPLSATLTADVRVTEVNNDLAAGRTWEDVRELRAEFDRVPGAHAAARFESSYITIAGQQFENWSAGLLLGVDPLDPSEAGRLAPYLVWGRPVDALDAIDPETGRGYAPLVLGASAVKRLNLTLSPDGEPDFDAILTVTSGRLLLQGSTPIPITLECVLVGVFETGLDPLDTFSGFTTIQAARVLAGLAENDPVANAIIVEGGRMSDLETVAARHPEMELTTDDEFAFGYMGSTLVVLYVAAYATLALFFLALFVWLAHETAVLVRSDAAVLSSMRAIGIPATAITQGYVIVSAGCIAVGAAAAWILSLVMTFLVPPLRWSLSGLNATIPWKTTWYVPTALGLGAILLAAAASWVTARRIRTLNILEGLRTA